MNEAEWLRCTDPTPMLQYLAEANTSDRKLRLLACACCRRIWGLLPDPRSRRAVEVAERYADGLATERELAQARAMAVAVPKGSGELAAYDAVSTRAGGPLWNVFAATAAAPAKEAARRAAGKQAETYETVQAANVREQADLIREVIGDPFRPRRINPAWLLFDGGVVGQLAEGIYQDRAFDRMPVLGDALEEAGCHDAAVLDHCRRGGEHVRGCWVLDLILDWG